MTIIPADTWMAFLAAGLVAALVAFFDAPLTFPGPWYRALRKPSMATARLAV